MARQIIILNKTFGPGGDQNITAAFWFAVSANQQYPQPAFVSAWRGISQSELAALRAGMVVEQAFSAQFPAGNSLAQVETALVTAYTAALSKFQSLANPNQFYGASYDGASWAAAPAIPPGTVQSLSFGALTVGASGDNTVIAGIAGQAIEIVQLQLAAAGAVTVLVKDGANQIGGYALTSGIPPVVLPATQYPWFVTSAGNNFTLNLSTAVSVLVSGWYRQS